LQLAYQLRFQTGLRQGTHLRLAGSALHKKSWAVIDRPYSLGCATVGALYERPRCIFCAKPAGSEVDRNYGENTMRGDQRFP